MKRRRRCSRVTVEVASIFITLLFLTTPAYTQVNIEELRQSSNTTGFSGSFALDLEAHTGNTDFQAIGVEGRLDFVRPTVITFILARSDFGWEQGQAFANEGLVHLRQDYRVRDRILFEAFAQYNYDKTHLLDFRALGGLGLRFQLFESSLVHFWQGSAYMLEHERLGGLPANAAHPTRTTVNRWNNYLTSRFTVNNRLASAWTVYVQPQFNAMRDVRVLGDASLEVGLGGPLVLVMSFSMRYDSRPPTGIKKFDTTLENSLAVTF